MTYRPSLLVAVHCLVMVLTLRHLSSKSWGLMFRRPEPLMDLPFVPYKWLEEDPSLPPFPSFHRDELVAFLDAAHATELRTRRSVTGYVLLFGNTAIAWKSRVQPVVATSSTEAEFYAAVTCAKAAKYLRSVLQQLEAIRPGATPLFVDNQAAIAMVNESRPTPRARHIEIQHFAIQEWREKGDIVLRHCPGIVNASDDLTKALGWVLHNRHARRSMGHYKMGSPIASTASALFAKRETTRAGEGVGTRSATDLTTWPDVVPTAERTLENVDDVDVQE